MWDDGIYLSSHTLQKWEVYAWWNCLLIVTTARITNIVKGQAK